MPSTRLWTLSVAAVALVVACDKGVPDAQPDTVPADQESISEPPKERPPSGSTRARTVYVPAYSHLPPGLDGQREPALGILLSVRNVDSVSTIRLTHVDYFDTSGHRVRRYLAEPRDLAPLETAEFSVETLDRIGGSGANFLVYWEGPADAHSLLTETVMLGHLGAGYVGFTSRGVELDRRPPNDAFERKGDAAPPEPATP